MSETKNEKFIRMRDQRLPKIIHALGLLENLSQNTYESSVQEREELIARLDEAVQKVAMAYGLDERASARMVDDAVSSAMIQPVTADELTPRLQKSDSPDSVAPAPEPVDYSDCPVCQMRESQEGAPDASPPQSRESLPSDMPKISSEGDIGPGFIAEGGASAFSEIAWAHDNIGKDNKLAKNRLARIITAWKR